MIEILDLFPKLTFLLIDSFSSKNNSFLPTHDYCTLYHGTKHLYALCSVYVHYKSYQILIYLNIVYLFYLFTLQFYLILRLDTSYI